MEEVLFESSGDNLFDFLELGTCGYMNVDEDVQETGLSSPFRFDPGYEINASPVAAEDEMLSSTNFMLDSRLPDPFIAEFSGAAMLVQPQPPTTLGNPDPILPKTGVREATTAPKQSLEQRLDAMSSQEACIRISVEDSTVSTIAEGNCTPRARRSRRSRRTTKPARGQAPVESPATRGRRRASTSTKRKRSRRSKDDEEDDGTAGDSGENDEKSRPVSKRERNKISASKYRKRRKVYMEELETQLGELNDTVQHQKSEISSLSTENTVLRKQLAMLKDLMKGVPLPSLDTVKNFVGIGSGSPTSASSDSDSSLDSPLEMDLSSLERSDEDSDRSTASYNGVGAGLMMFSAFALLACSPELPSYTFPVEPLQHSGRTICGYDADPVPSLESWDVDDLSEDLSRDTWESVSPVGAIKQEWTYTTSAFRNLQLNQSNGTANSSATRGGVFSRLSSLFGY